MQWMRFRGNMSSGWNQGRVWRNRACLAGRSQATLNKFLLDLFSGREHEVNSDSLWPNQISIAIDAVRGLRLLSALMFCALCLLPPVAAAEPSSSPANRAEPRSNTAAASRIEAFAAPKSIRFGAEHGLSKNITDLTVDRQGYVWVATIDGLARYDGSGFRFWRHQSGRTDTLLSNIVLDLQVDRRDRLWVATDEGVSVLERDRRAFRHIRLEGATRRCRDTIVVLGDGVDDTLWIGTFDGAICRVDREGHPAVVELKDSRGHRLPIRIPMAFHVAPSGVLWIGTASGLIRWHRGVADRPADAVIGTKTVYALSAESDGSVLVGAEGGFYRVDKAGAVTDLSAVLPKNADKAIVVADGRFGRWMGTSKGLFRRELSERPPSVVGEDWREGRTYALMQTAEQHVGAESLLSQGVYTMEADREGGLWVVGNTEGLMYVPASWRRFVSIDRIEGRSVERLGMVALTVDASGQLWWLTTSGLYAISNADATPRIAASLSVLGLSDPRAVAVCSSKVLIAGTDGLVAFDPRKAASARIPIEVPDQDHFYPMRILCAPHGEIVISQYGGGVDVYSAEGRLLRTRTPQQTFGYASTSIAEIAIASDGSQWHANDRALFRWDGARYRSYALAPGGAVSTFTFAGANDVWVARSGALERYRWNGESLRLQERVGAAQGVPDVFVEGMMVAANGNLWLSTGRGLAVYDPRLSRVRLFGGNDGLPGTDFYYGAPVFRSARRAAALSTDGLVLFDPEGALPNAKPSVLAIETLSIRRGREDIALDPAQPVTLRGGDRDLRIVPRLLSFSNAQSHRYRSRLHGEDPGWVLQQGPSERVFSILPQGRYVLELQAANADGVWSAPVSLQVEVLPPWWRSAWALVAYVLLGSALLWWLAYLDQLKLKRQHRYQLARQKREWAEQASEAKSRFLADLGHELRTPMTGVLGMSELLLGSELPPRQHGQVQSIRRAGEHLLRLVDDALDLAKIEAGRLELQAVEFGLNGLIEDVSALISPLAARKGLRFVAQRMPDVNERWIGDPLRLQQILLNLLGNAVKFTERGEVGLRIEAVIEVAIGTEATASTRFQQGIAEARIGEGHAVEAHAVEGHAVEGRVVETPRATSGVSPAQQALRIVVSDTGPGMDAEQLQRVFRRFEQADGARTTARYGGTGLGLAISRELALAMGGKIKVRSEPGCGTEFELCLTLPVGRLTALVEPAQRIEIASRRAISAMAGADWRVVLLVEDDPTVAEVLTGLLRQQGHRVVHAAHGLAALTEAAVGRFDAALIDLDLPGIDGCALAGQLRIAGFAAPMLAITARADADAEPQAMAAGFVGFLRKPTTGERLRAAIATILVANTADSMPLQAASTIPGEHSSLPA
jgi:signal transduction histidine kinase/ActR/RegA family two-component response regulator